MTQNKTCIMEVTLAAVSIREAAQGVPNNKFNQKMPISIVLGIDSFCLVVLLVAYLERRTRRVDDASAVIS